MALIFTGRLDRSELIACATDCMIRRYAFRYAVISLIVTISFAVIYVIVQAPACQIIVPGMPCDPTVVLQGPLLIWCCLVFFGTLPICYVIKTIDILLNAKDQTEDVVLELHPEKVTLIRPDGRSNTIPAKRIAIKTTRTNIFGYAKVKGKVWLIFSLPYRHVTSEQLEVIKAMYPKAKWYQYPNQ